MTSYRNLSFLRAEFYYFLAGLIAVEIASVSLIHQIQPEAGKALLPIYLFVLLGTIFLGSQVGLGLAVLLPFASLIITGMPQGIILLGVLFKSLTLVSFFWILSKLIESPYLTLLSALFSYQLLGFLFLFLFSGNTSIIFNDWQTGYPGLILQIVLGMLSLHLILRKKQK